jgi:hypothetical protein
LLVLYYLPAVAPAADSLPAGIRHAGAGDPPTPPAWEFLPDHWHAIFYPQHPLNRGSVTRSGLSADRILLAADEQTRI